MKNTETAAENLDYNALRLTCLLLKMKSRQILGLILRDHVLQWKEEKQATFEVTKAQWC